MNHVVMDGNILRMLWTIFAPTHGTFEWLFFRVAPHVAVNVICPFATVVTQLAPKLPQAFVQVNHQVLLQAPFPCACETALITLVNLH